MQLVCYVFSLGVVIFIKFVTRNDMLKEFVNFATAGTVPREENTGVKNFRIS